MIITDFYADWVDVYDENIRDCERIRATAISNGSLRLVKKMDEEISAATEKRNGFYKKMLEGNGRYVGK